MNALSPGIAEAALSDDALSEARDRLDAERLELVATTEAFEAFYGGDPGRAPTKQRARHVAFCERAATLAEEIAAIDRQRAGGLAKLELRRLVPND